jgi:H+/Cl- antiporter ClcA/CBS domain-containing protein
LAGSSSRSSRPASHHPAARPTHLGDFAVTRDVLRTCLLAVPVGILSALVAYALLKLIGLCTNLFFYGRVDFNLVVPSSSHWLVVLLVPIAGGLVVGLMARFGSEKIRGHGMPEAIESILTGGSKVEPKVSVLKPISAAISIGSGGPFGAEGPIIMSGGAVGSVLAQFLKLTADHRKTLLVAGAAGGMAATFNTPLASILLAVELLLFEWRPRSLMPVVVSVVFATIIRRVLLGSGAIFAMPNADLHLTPEVYALCVVAGCVGGVIAIGATGLVYFAEDMFHKLPIHWMWWPAIGGAVIGIGGLIEPHALGVGYDVIRTFLQGHATMSLILGILVVKTLIWGLSLGSGTSGGVLAPVFMIGGALGALQGEIFPHVGPGFWALMGLAAVVGGVMRSPLTGIVFSLELTHEWNALLPVVVASVTAYGLSVLLLKRSVLTEKVARRGFHLTREYSVDPLEVLFVREVMWRQVVTFPSDAGLAEAGETFAERELVPTEERERRQRLYPVVDSGDRLLGVLSRRDMLDAALTGDDEHYVKEVMVRDPLVVYPDQTLREVAYVFAQHGVNRAPVVDRAEPDRLVGLVTLTQLLQGRLRDLEEERIPERVLRVRITSALGRRRSRVRERTTAA